MNFTNHNTASNNTISYNHSMHISPINIINNNNNNNFTNGGSLRNSPAYENPTYVAYFYGRLLREESEKILKNRGCRNGLFLLRELVQEVGSYALSICYQNEVHHYKIDRQEDGTVKIAKGRKFIGPIELVKHHQIEQDGLITKPSIPCERPRGTTPINYLFVNDSELNKLIDDEIKNQIVKLKPQMSSRQYNQELNDARGKFRYKYERLVIIDLHSTQPWYRANCERSEAHELLLKAGFKNGKFLVRSSNNSSGASNSSSGAKSTNTSVSSSTSSLNDFYKISLMYNNEIKHYKIKHIKSQYGSGKFSLEGGIEFESIIQLVDYYHRCSDGLADKLRIPLLVLPDRLDSVWLDNNIYDSNTMYNAIVDKDLPPSPDYLDDEPPNRVDVPDLTRVPENKVDLFKDEENYDYDSLSSYTVDLKDLSTYDKLGSGCFGSVYRGTYKVKDHRGNLVQELPVAIKQLNLDTNESRDEIAKEADIMKSLKHKHIIKFIGMCIDHNKLMIVLELAKLGPLHKYLRSHKQMSMLKIVKLCYQVALAMQYLASKNLVHRDLAARNVLLSSEDLAKVSDFGMSRCMDENLYYTTQSQGKWPLKWYPPEVSSSGRFDEKSDVWSFGVTCWEATSYGGRPYQGIDITLLILKLENGHRLEKPQTCPQEIFNIMYKCWHAKKEQRPNFVEIVGEMKSVLSDMEQFNN